MIFRRSIASLAIVSAFAGPAGAVNLVANPGFETGDFTSWTVAGGGLSVDSVFPNTGNYDAAFSALNTDPNPGVLSQSLTTAPGQSYTISFALLDEAGFPDNSFIVTFGAFTTTITGDTAGPPGTLPSGYTPFSFTAPGAAIVGSSTTLSFEGLQSPLANQNWNLDDVSVTASVPEPASWALLLLAFASLALRRPAGSWLARLRQRPALAGAPAGTADTSSERGR